jgi:hypothetical protein
MPNVDEISSLAIKAHIIVGNIFEEIITDQIRELMGGE